MDPEAKGPDIAATPPETPASDIATAPADPASAPLPEDGAAARNASRRRFLRWLGGLTIVSTAAMILTPIFGFLVPSSTGQAAAGGKVLVGTTTDIPPGAGKVVAMGSKPAVVVNTDQGVKAYSAICTHLGCVVAWNDMTGQIQCPCHGGEFNPANGYVMSGPPPAPLPPLTVSVENGQIFLSEA